MAGPRLLDAEITTKPTTAPSESACTAQGHGSWNRRPREIPRGHPWERSDDGGGGWEVTVYPGRWAGDRWRAVWYKGGVRRQCQAVSEERLAARLEKIAERPP